MPDEVMMVYDLLLAEGPARPQTPARPRTLDTSDPNCPLEVTVIFTGLKVTTRALRSAAELADNLHGRIRLVVPQVVPFPLPLESPPVLVRFQEERFRKLACELPVETRVEIYLCRDADDLLTERLEPHSAVVIGACKHWWPTREKALARKLRRKGHEVMLAYME
jgi:hypothetical protein